MENLPVSTVKVLVLLMTLLMLVSYSAAQDNQLSTDISSVSESLTTSTTHVYSSADDKQRTTLTLSQMSTTGQVTDTMPEVTTSLPELDGYCSQSSQCEHLDHATCDNTKCVCSTGFYRYLPPNACYPVPQITMDDQIISVNGRMEFCPNLIIATEVCLTWSLIFQNSMTLPNDTQFNVTYKGEAEKVVQLKESEVVSRNETFLSYAGRIQSLNSGVKYDFMVQAVSDLWSVKSGTAEYWTAPTAPIVLGCTSTATSVTLQVQKTSTTERYYVTACHDRPHLPDCISNGFDLGDNITVEGLVAGRRYSVQVLAAVHDINSTVSNQTYIYTAPTAPTVTDYTPTDTSVTLQVRNTSNTERYHVTVCPDPPHSPGCVSEEFNVGDNITVERLIPGRRYSVEVLAVADDLNSTVSNPSYIYTVPSLLEVKVDEAVSDITTEAFIRWSIPENSQPSGFNLTYSSHSHVGQDPILVPVAYSTDKTEYALNLTALSPGVTYSVTVTAFKAGTRELSSNRSQIYTTYPKAPEIGDIRIMNEKEVNFPLKKLTNSRTDGYIIIYCYQDNVGSKNHCGNQTMVTGGNDTVLVQLADLSPFQTYNISARSWVNSAGDHKYSPDTSHKSVNLAPGINVSLVTLESTTCDGIHPEHEACLRLRFSFHVTAQANFTVSCHPTVVSPVNSLLVAGTSYMYVRLTGLQSGVGYNCTMTATVNRWSTTSKSVTFVTCPTAPIFVDYTAVEHSVTLRINKTSDLGAKEIYDVTYCDVSSACKEIGIQGFASDTSHVKINLTGLQPSKTYSIYLRARVTEQGTNVSSINTMNVTVFTAPSKPNRPELSGEDGQSLVASWNSTGSQSYSLRYRRQKEVVVVNTSCSPTCNEKLEHLTYGGVYIFTVQAFNGPWSASSDSALYAMTPMNPQVGSIVSVTEKSIMLHWIHSDGLVDFFLIQYGTVNITTPTIDPNAVTTDYNVVGLKGGYEYEFHILAGINFNNGTKLGTSAKPLKLTNHTVPSPPSGEDITELKSDSVSFTFTNSSLADTFIIETNPKDVNIKPGEVTYIDGHQSAGICGLIPGTVYTITITAMAGVWYSQPYNFTLTTNETSPGVPGGLKVEAVTSNTMSITWEEPIQPNGQIKNYVVSYWRKSLYADEWHKAGNSTTEAGHRTALITQLSPGHCYRLSVSAVNGAGVGMSSANVTNTTYETAPSSSSVYASVRGSHEIQVNWSPPSEQNGIIRNYTVQANSSLGKVETLCFLCCDCPSPDEVCMEKKDIPSHTHEDMGCPSQQQEGKSSSLCQGFSSNNSMLTATVSKLHPYYHYTVTLTACTNAGCSLNHSAVDTEQDAPSAPQILEATAKSSMSVKLKWSVPAETNGVIQYYIVHYNGSKVNTTDNQTSFIINELDKYSLYAFTVQGVTVKPGSLSETVSARTNEDIPDSPPREVNAKALNSTVIQLSWQPPSEPNGNVESYRIVFSLSDGTGKPGNISVPGTVNTYDVTGLGYWMSYSFIISALTQVGEGPKSPAVTAITNEHAPTTAPVNFLAQMTNATAIQLSWGPPVHPNGKITMYEITYSTEDTGPIHLKPDKKQISMLVTGLKFWTTYEFSITASTSAGAGPAAVKSQTTDEYVPTSAVVKVIGVQTATSVELDWSPPKEPNGVILLYSITYSARKHVKGSSKIITTVVNTTTNVTTHNLTGLYEYWNYLVTIQAFTIKGAGQLSSRPYNIRTEQSVPDKPEAIEATALNDTAIELSWQPPDFPNGIILGYTIRYNQSSVFVGNVTTAVIGRLGIWTEYKFFIHANTSVGAGEVDNVLCRTKESAPMQPTDSTDIPLIDIAVGVPIDHERQVAISLPLYFFQDESRGEITSRGIIVIEAVLLNRTVEKILYGGQKRTITEITKSCVTWKQYYETGVRKPYRATSDTWDPTAPGTPAGDRRKRSLSTVNYILGKDRDCQSEDVSGITYCNGYLKPGTQYRVKAFVCNKGGCTDTYYSKAISTDPIPADVGPGIAGAVVGILLALGVIAVVLYMKRSGRGPFAKKQYSSGTDIEVTVDGGTEVELVSRNRPIDLVELEAKVAKMKRSSNFMFAEEYKDLRDLSPRHPHNASELEVNRPKNRYTNILPFDQSRVKLLPLDDDEGSDYINASYIPGYNSKREYIAAQGPLPATKDDFWRMIWEQNVSLIVMVTKCVEGRGRIKCEKYWPFDEEAVYFGELIVQKRSESVLPEYDIRILDIRLGESNTRTVKHFHFLKWPDFGCPTSTQSLLNFAWSVRSHKCPVSPGPILVHCRQRRSIL